MSAHEIPNEIDALFAATLTSARNATHCFVWQALYFVSFMVLCYFYVLNLVLAVAVNAYDESLSERRISRVELSKKLLSEAFTLLSSNGENVNRETIMHVSPHTAQSRTTFNADLIGSFFTHPKGNENPRRRYSRFSRTL